MKYCILPFLISFLISCSSNHSNEYKVLNRGENFVTIELRKRTTAENLLIYAEEAQEMKGSDLYHVSFMLPSEYPVNPDGTPWASVMYKPDGNTVLNIYGTRSDKHKKNLLALKFHSDQQIGKWYYQVPIEEKVVFIAELDGKWVLSEFKVPSVSQKSDAPQNEPKIKDITQSLFEQWEPYIELERNPENSNEFRFKGTKLDYWEYRIGDDKKLLFLNAKGEPYKEAVPIP